MEKVNNIDEIEKALKELLDSSMTSYEIAKKSGVTISMIDRYRKGESMIENITLKTAKKILKINGENT